MPRPCDGALSLTRSLARRSPDETPLPEVPHGRAKARRLERPCKAAIAEVSSERPDHSLRLYLHPCNFCTACTSEFG